MVVCCVVGACHPETADPKGISFGAEVRTPAPSVNPIAYVTNRFLRHIELPLYRGCL